MKPYVARCLLFIIFFSANVKWVMVYFLFAGVGLGEQRAPRRLSSCIASCSEHIRPMAPVNSAFRCSTCFGARRVTFDGWGAPDVTGYRNIPQNSSGSLGPSFLCYRRRALG